MRVFISEMVKWAYQEIRRLPILVIDVLDSGATTKCYCGHTLQWLQEGGGFSLVVT
jgi:hypothetical protein